MFPLLPGRILPLLLALGGLAACHPTVRDPQLESAAAGSSAAASAPSGPAHDLARRTAPAGAPDFSSLVREVGPAVVNITAVRSGASPEAAGGPGPGDDPMLEFFRRFMPDQDPGNAPPGRAPRSRSPMPMPMPMPPDEQMHGLGAGCIISADGYVLTNAHVVADAQDVTVRLSDARREYKARVVGIDRRSDVAVLKIDAGNLPVARVGDSRKVQPGEWVAAIGSPFGFSNTVTAGIVSATGRALPDESFVPFIQTDVAVNPGNSGGPLINLRGEVVGLNSQIYSRTGGYMGVSFAVPSDVVMEVFEQLRTRGKVIRGWLGVSIQPVTLELARSFKLNEPRGALVSAVQPGSPAARAALVPGDIILAFAGQPLDDDDELPQRVTRTAPGTPVLLEVWRRGERQQVQAMLGELPPDPQVVQAPPEPAPAAARAPATNRLGLVLAELSAVQRRVLGMPYGLMVRDVRGPAAAAALRRGDIVTAVNGVTLESAGQLDRMLAEQAAGAPVALLVRRGEESIYVPVKVG
jgi:serine protease Do